MSSLKGKFTRIKSRFSESRVLPRLGKIRLGVKVEKQGRNGTVEFPRETDYFVCPPEVEAVYGEAPTELDVLLPSDDPEVVFQQKLVLYGSGAGVKCQGNGEQAERLNEQTRQFEPCICPCPHLKTPENPKGQCTEKSNLMVILPTVSMGGCYQLTTSSFHSTRNINSSLDMTKAVAGRIALLPMKLRRVAQETHHDGKKQTHYVLNLVLNASWQELADLRANPNAILIPSQYQIEGPIDENPTLDPPDIQEIDAEKLADMDNAELADIQAKLKAQREQGKADGGAGISARHGDLAENTAPTQQDPDAPSLIPPGPLPAGKIEPAVWEQAIQQIRSMEDWNTLIEDWASGKVKNVLRMVPAGQQALLAHLREQIGTAFPF